MDRKEPIRVAHIIGKWVGGGVEAVVMNYYRNIDHTKIQFDFICDDDSIDIPYEEIENMGGKVILIPPYQKIIKYNKILKMVLKDGNYKIVHSHINTLSVFSLFAAKCAGVPVRIAHSHSTTNKKEVKKNIMKQLLRPFSKLFATDYFACTEHAGRWLFGNKTFNGGNVYILNNAIDLDKFKFDEEIRRRKRKEMNIDDTTLVIGHVGRFVEQKNHDFLINIFNEIYKENKDSLLVLVGQGPLMENIKLKVSSMGLENNVRFMGQKKDVSYLYQVFDVFVFPSIYEGLGMTVVEAQASGCACVCSTKVPKVVKVIDEVFFISLDDEIKKWVNRVLNNKSLFNKSETLKKLKMSKYNIKNEVIKLESFYTIRS